MSVIDEWTKMCTLQHQIRTKLELALKPNNLELNEYYVLYYLSKEPHLTLRINELEQKIDLSQSALSRTISRMESKDCGVIERAICEDDKRGRYVKLTDIGKRTLASAQIKVDEVLDKYFKN